MRGLLAAVVAMGVLIVVGVTTLGVLVARRISSSPPVPEITLNEPAGSHIENIAPAGPDRLFVHIQGTGGDHVDVIDLRSGRTTSRVRLSSPDGLSAP